MNAILGELKRVVKPGGEVVMVVGNSFLRGAVIDNAGIVESLAESVGFRRVGQEVRKIPARRRYLPPPNSGGENALDFRIREETTLTFVSQPPRRFVVSPSIDCKRSHRRRLPPPQL